MLVLVIAVLLVLFAATVAALWLRGTSRAESEQTEPSGVSPIDLALGLVCLFVLGVLGWLIFYPPFAY